MTVVIEGGGTRTRAWLVDAKGSVVREFAAGPSNVRRLGAPAFAALVRGLVDQFGEPGARLSIGVAGVSKPEEAAAVRDALQAVGLTQATTITSDAALALEGALDGGPGVLLIAGTGSIAFGRTAQGREDRAGGWGRELGDEGSGYALGRGVMNRLTWALDGRRHELDLLARAIRWLSLPDDTALAAWVRMHAADPERVAAMAELAFDLARNGDARAQFALEQAALDLAVTARAACERLDLGPRPRLVLHGGLMQDHDYRAHVEAAFKKSYPEAEVLLGAPDIALKGGLRLAQAIA